MHSNHTLNATELVWDLTAKKLQLLILSLNKSGLLHLKLGTAFLVI